jgi:signal peptide peptidase SppA
MVLPHLAGRLIGTPLLLARAKLDVLLAVLGERIGAPQVSVAAFEPVIAPSVRTQASIAVIPVFGTLVRRTHGLEAASGLTSYAELSARLQAATVDPAIRGILLEIDSPGGEAGGVFELAEQVRALAQLKPVWAVVVDSALSAAYAIAAAAHRVVVTRTAGVGSIGVIAMHVDQSTRDAQQGYRYTPVLAGAYKADLSPHAALAPEALTRLQREVDRLHDLFVDHVALMRGLDANAIRATEAGLYFADDAVRVGLADAVGGFDDTLAEFTQFLAQAKPVGRLGPHAALLTPTPTIKDITMSTVPSDIPLPSKSIQPASAPDVTKPIDVPDEDIEKVEVAPATASAPATPSAPATQSAAAQVTRSFADARVIVEMCALAGRADRALGFLDANAGVDQVRRTLLSELATGPEIGSLLPPIGHRTSATPSDPAAAADSPTHNPVLAAVAKLRKG